MIPSRLSEVWPDLERAARGNGVAHLGASGLDDAHAGLFSRWIESGYHASMTYLARNAAVRTNPRDRYPWAKSVVVVLVPYASERPHAGEDALSAHIARYAQGDDYHEVLEAILERMEAELRGAKSWRYVDTGPLSDRSYAAQAGLGWIGRNGMLIHEEDGSWFFIGTLVTALENDLSPALVADRCGECTRCVDACPTEAILPGRLVDSARCISYATIEHRGPLDPAVSSRLNGNAFGCDICQEVCPWNAHPPESHPAFVPREAYRATPLTDLLRMSQSSFSTLFRRSAVKRAKLAGMQRNVEAIAGARRL